MATLFQELMQQEQKFVGYQAELDKVKVVNNETEQTSFPAPLLKSIIDDAAQTHILLKSDPKLSDTNVAAKSKSFADPEKKITYLQAFEEISAEPLIIADNFPEVNGQITLPNDIFNLLVNKSLTWMATIPHQAAPTSIGDTNELMGCTVTSFDKKDAIPLAAYCSGVIGKKANVITQDKIQIIPFAGEKYKANYHTYIMHSLGLHGVEPSISAVGQEYKMKVKYHDSGPPGYMPGSKYRLDATKQRLELLGFKCYIGGSNSIVPNSKPGDDSLSYLYCDNDDLSTDTIQKLAIFFSLLQDGDNELGQHSGAGQDSVPVIRDQVWKQADQYVKKYGNDVWNAGLHNNAGHWKSVWQTWKKQGNVIYSDLRELLYLRDMHHMIEDAYHIGNDSHSPTPAYCPAWLNLWTAKP